MSVCICSGLKHDDWGYHSDYCPVYLTGRVKELEAEIQSQEHQWIPVSTRLPEQDTPCIAYMADRDSCILTHYFDDFALARTSTTKGFSEHGVTHWMPLPPPPKEKTSD